jgi:regulator of protease activity HflC (stomatin/prohibitin superfamily)
MFKKIVLSFFLVTLLSGCTEIVDPGHIGVLVRNPYIFGVNGVDKIQTYEEGRHVVAFTSYMVQYNIQPIQQEESFNDLSTITSTPVDFKAIIRYKIIPEKANILHSKFSKNVYELNIRKDFQNALRDFTRSKTVQELTRGQTTTDTGEEEVLAKMVKLISEKDIPIQIMAVTIGAISPPEDVLLESARTEAQTQRATTEAQRAIAEEQRQQAETKKALADLAYMSGMNMTATEYLQRLRIETDREIIETIKKKDNVNIIFTMGGSQPTLTYPGNKK